VEGRWHNGQPQFRLRIGESPKSGPRWWSWWFNQDQASFNKHIHDLADDNFVMVCANSFQWPDGTTRYNGVWHRVGRQEIITAPTPAPIQGWAEKKDTEKKFAALLVGKWIDENSEVEYRADGNKKAKYLNGPQMEGTWSLEGDVIKFIPQGGGVLPCTGFFR
jgi:hypothetical protein